MKILFIPYIPDLSNLFVLLCSLSSILDINPFDVDLPNYYVSMPPVQELGKFYVNFEDIVSSLLYKSINQRILINSITKALDFGGYVTINQFIVEILS